MVVHELLTGKDPRDYVPVQFYAFSFYFVLIVDQHFASQFNVSDYECTTKCACM